MFWEGWLFPVCCGCFWRLGHQPKQPRQGTGTKILQQFEIDDQKKIVMKGSKNSARAAASWFSMLIAVSLLPNLALSQTNYCCNPPNFGSDWCHSSSCMGAGCRNEPDPITGESQSNYLCDDLSSCVCAGAYAQLLQSPPTVSFSVGYAAAVVTSNVFASVTR